jgi:aldose 1-epimerase
MQTSRFGRLPDGREVRIHSLTNRAGAELRFLDYGGIVTSLSMPDRDGRLADVVLGFDSLEAYRASRAYFGAITGRVAGRIPRGRLAIDGVVWQLPLNDGENHLHGGHSGLDRRLWEVSAVPRTDGAASATLRYRSPDGEEGYPGNVEITVTYTLTDANEFIVSSEAISDRSTPVSLTHHSYFNLGGEGGDTVLDHEFLIRGEQVVEMGDDLAPTGRVMPVEGRAGDFRQARRLGEAVAGLNQGHGDLYLLPTVRDNRPVVAARACHTLSGRVLTVSTTERCLQFYTGSHLANSSPGKSGRGYGRFSGFCLECQGSSAGLSAPGFDDILVRPGEPQRRTTIYAFSTD